MRIGIVGVGHWGSNYVRVFGQLDSSELVACADSDVSRSEELCGRIPGLKIYEDAHGMLREAGLEAVVVSTPADTHYELVKAALESGCHVLVEKPMTCLSAQSEELVRLAEDRGLTLMVGHTFLYNPGVRKMKELVKSDSFGSMYYMTAIRTHMGMVRADVSTMWDLGAHDVAIFMYVTDSVPGRVSAVSGYYLNRDRADVAYVTLFFPGGVLGNITVSWVDSNKVRQVVAIGSKQRILFDDLDQLERVRVFEKGISIDKPIHDYGEFQFLLRDGDIISPKIEMEEPLRVLTEHFLECASTGRRPISDGRNGLDVVRVLEAAEESAKNCGVPVDVTQKNE